MPSSGPRICGISLNAPQRSGTNIARQKMASSLAFYGALALAGLALVAVYTAAHIVGNGAAAAQARGQAGNIAGSHNAQMIDAVLREAGSRGGAWIALVVGAVMFIAAVTATAFHLQQVLDVIWGNAAPASTRAIMSRSSRRFIS